VYLDRVRYSHVKNIRETDTRGRPCSVIVILRYWNGHHFSKMKLKMGFSTVQNDDLTRKYGKMNGRLATFRPSSLWQCVACHTEALLAKAREP
jgi:hypothetical protein